ncbi:MAG: bifunctional histidine phosphatase family protein/GNAT family N-acetyltransferase [Clostridiales bacterium]|nr:bifunctional histidine phosphatase family protein/GNAT family N-acetyltransferase [Clostridiales bacterium]
MTEIYVIRHAQAEGNLYHMMQGTWDGDVTALGLRQIDALAERFRHIPIDALYSSDLYRTRLTASAITRWHDVPIQLDKRLREMHVGPWETQFFANVGQDYPEEFRAFISDPEHFHLDGAESYIDVRERTAEALREIALLNPGRTVAVVTHGLAIRCMLSGVCGIPLDDTAALPIFTNTGVAKLQYENGVFTPVYINDHSHLSPELMPRADRPLALRHEYIDPAMHRDYYIACYTDAWLAAHGSLDGFSPEPYYTAAKAHYEADSESVAVIYSGSEPIGLVDMDTLRGAHAGYGWISLLYLNSDFRSKGYGIQLLGRAIGKYGRLGRNALRLLVSEDNGAAIGFYKKYGFRRLSAQPGTNAELLLMERRLGGVNHGNV